jgi:hypothetical protein
VAEGRAGECPPSAGGRGPEQAPGGPASDPAGCGSSDGQVVSDWLVRIMVVFLLGCVRRSGHPKEGARGSPRPRAVFFGGTRGSRGGSRKSRSPRRAAGSCGGAAHERPRARPRMQTERVAAGRQTVSAARTPSGSEVGLNAESRGDFRRSRSFNPWRAVRQAAGAVREW